MVDILTSVHGRRLGLDHEDNLVVAGEAIFLNGVRVSDVGAPVEAGSTLTLTVEEHSGKLIALDTATGSTVTLPAATGSGAKFRFYVETIATSNAHIVKVANANDTMIGFVHSVDDTSDNVVGFIAGSTADTITLNGSTTGSVSIGEYIEVEDIAATKWLVRGFISNTGAPATPFSAAVS